MKHNPMQMKYLLLKHREISTRKHGFVLKFLNTQNANYHTIIKN